MAANLKAQDAGTLRTITRGYARLAGVTRTLKTAKVMDGGVLRTVAIFASPLSLTASPAGAANTYESFGMPLPQTLTTDLITAIPAGGLAPFTYAWAYLSGDVFSVSHPTGAGTYFNYTFNAFGFRSATYRCTVTDSVGSTATVDVPISIEFMF